jgi:hypothetical protein
MRFGEVPWIEPELPAAERASASALAGNYFKLWTKASTSARVAASARPP